MVRADARSPRSRLRRCVERSSAGGVRARRSPACPEYCGRRETTRSSSHGFADPASSSGQARKDGSISLVRSSAARTGGAHDRDSPRLVTGQFQGVARRRVVGGPLPRRPRRRRGMAQPVVGSQHGGVASPIPRVISRTRGRERNRSRVLQQLLRCGTMDADRTRGTSDVQQADYIRRGLA